MCPLAETIFDKKTRDAEVFMHHKNGHRIPVAVRTSVLTDSGGNIIGGIELFTDLSEKAANEIRIRELEKLALLDYLTQLANRVYIEKELQIRIEEYKRFQIPFGIFFMDIDNFKTFNDTCGHALGDEILKCVANTFVFNARPFDLYGRWGGEEFIAIIKNIKSADLELLGNRIRMLIENTYIMHDNQKMEVTISVGATQVTETDTVNSIIERADTLMYKSKAAGKNCVTSG
jgi:diguanylate cyclase (GGDEF)-like protein